MGPRRGTPGGRAAEIGVFPCDDAIDSRFPKSQVRRQFPDPFQGYPVAKPELGTKRICGSCGAKFYDLSKDPIVCPKCGTVFEVVVPVARARPDARAAVPVAAAAVAAATIAPAHVQEQEIETTETEGAEFVSLEDADAEAQGKKPAAADAEGESEEDIEVADDETMDDDAFIEETEEGDADVTDIIGDAGEKEEES